MEFYINVGFHNSRSLTDPAPWSFHRLQCVFVTLVIGPEWAGSGCWGGLWLAARRGEEWDGSARPAVRGAEETARRVLKGQRPAASQLILSSRSLRVRVSERVNCSFFVYQSKCLFFILFYFIWTSKISHHWWEVVSHVHVWNIKKADLSTLLNF